MYKVAHCYSAVIFVTCSLFINDTTQGNCMDFVACKRIKITSNHIVESTMTKNLLAIGK